MKNIMQKIIHILITCFTLITLNPNIVGSAQNHRGVTATYQGISIQDKLSALSAMSQAYNETVSSLNSLQSYIVDLLGKEIDSQLRQELNNDLKELDAVAEALSRTGHVGNARNGCNNIYRNVQKEVANYNNRVARERERLAQEEAEKRALAAHPQNWSGSGFALRGGYVVTNYHVIERATQVKVKGINGDFNTSYSATIVACDTNNDLAIIKISDSRFSGFGPIPYNINFSISDVGEDVWTLGFPLTQVLGNEIKLTKGVISSRSGYQNDISTYQMSAPVQPGSSGGPLFDSKGSIIGIVNAGVPGAENVGYAIKTTYLKNLVDRYNLSANLPGPNIISSLALKDQVKKVKDFVLLLVCSSETSSLVSSNSTAIRNIQQNPSSSITNSSPYPSTSSESSSSSGWTSSTASYLTVSTTSITAERTDGFVIVDVKTDASDYSVSMLPSWCKVKNKYKTWFSLSYTANPNSYSRTGCFYVTAGGKTEKVTITQKANYSSYSGSSGSSSSRSSSSSDKAFQIGLDASIDCFLGSNYNSYFYDDSYHNTYDFDTAISFGFGLRARIGRNDQFFNLIGGVRYVFGSIHSGVLVPVLLKMNFLRLNTKGMSLCIGGGYEFGFTDTYDGDGMLQFGVCGSHYDLAMCYKPKNEVLGLGFTYYF